MPVSAADELIDHARYHAGPYTMLNGRVALFNGLDTQKIPTGYVAVECCGATGELTFWHNNRQIKEKYFRKLLNS